jgi:hypothetical protein
MTRLNSIKKIRLVLLLFIFSTSISAQTAHFLYIQSDNSQAFYVRLNNKVFSSSDIGFLIIPKLQTGKLSLIIGFPMNKWNAMNYDVEVENKDMSFRLKKVDSLNWELYDDQGQHTIFKNKTDKLQYLMENNNDEFSNVLAEVSNNPKIKQSRKITQAIDSSNLKSETKMNVVEQLDSNQVDMYIAQIEKIKNRQSEIIKKEFSYIDSTGNLIKYVINDDGKSDTVSIFISFATSIKSDKNVSQQISAIENVSKETITQLPTLNSATEKDFLQLRKQMILEENEERMIDIAEKAFETTAFTTEMMKNVAVLFLKENNKLSFLLRAYKYVSDKQNFNSLSTLLSEEKNLIQFNHLFE